MGVTRFTLSTLLRFSRPGPEKSTGGARHATPRHSITPFNHGVYGGWIDGGGSMGGAWMVRLLHGQVDQPPLLADEQEAAGARQEAQAGRRQSAWAGRRSPSNPPPPPPPPSHAGGGGDDDDDLAKGGAPVAGEPVVVDVDVAAEEPADQEPLGRPAEDKEAELDAKKRALDERERDQGRREKRNRRDAASAAPGTLLSSTPPFQN